jgi:hypothetical protein
MHQMVQRMKPAKNRQIFLKQRGAFSPTPLDLPLFVKLNSLGLDSDVILLKVFISVAKAASRCLRALTSLAC